MADGKTLNAKNLERLGASRLAALLIEIADTTVARRRLRTELAGSFGPEEAARDIRRRLAAIRQAQGALSRKRTAAVVAELVEHWAAVVTLVAPDAPALFTPSLCHQRLIMLASTPVQRYAAMYLTLPNMGSR